MSSRPSNWPTGRHIGINALYLIPGGVGGTEIYLRSLLQALASIDRINRYTVFTNREADAGLVPSQANFRSAPQPISGLNRPVRILWEQIFLPRHARHVGVEVLFNPGFTAPAFGYCPNVTVFHDLQHLRHPEYFRWFDLPFWRLLLYSSVRRSERLIAVSPATARDLIHFYRVAPRVIDVIQHGVDEAFFSLRRPSGPPRPMLLCVSTLHPHKNLDRLLRAFKLFLAKHPGYRLTIAGLRGFHAEQLEHLRAELDLEQSVRFTGWIPRAELYQLFCEAIAFIYPSLFEGFGMPILEAFAAGIPTACSNVEPMKSIAAEAALQFDPQSVEAIHEALETITFDEPLRRRLISAGARRAARFSWKTAAASTLTSLIAAIPENAPLS